MTLLSLNFRLQLNQYFKETIVLFFSIATLSILSENLFLAMFFFCNINCALWISGDWIWNCSCQPFVAWRVSECLNISPLNEFRILPWIHSGILIGWMILVPPTWRFQKSHRRKRTRSVEDDEEGHLICQSGDVLRARCIEYFSTLFKLCRQNNLFKNSLSAGG